MGAFWDSDNIAVGSCSLWIVYFVEVCNILFIACSLEASLSSENAFDYTFCRSLFPPWICCSYSLGVILFLNKWLDSQSYWTRALFKSIVTLHIHRTPPVWGTQGQAPVSTITPALRKPALQLRGTQWACIRINEDSRSFLQPQWIDLCSFDKVAEMYSQ